MDVGWRTEAIAVEDMRTWMVATLVSKKSTLAGKKEHWMAIIELNIFVRNMYEGWRRPPDSIHRQIACNIFRLVADKVCSMAFVYVSYLSIRPDTHARSSITHTTHVCCSPYQYATNITRFLYGRPSRRKWLYVEWYHNVSNGYYTHNALYVSNIVHNYTVLYV